MWNKGTPGTVHSVEPNHLIRASDQESPQDNPDWWVLWTGLADGAWNMALDEWLMATAPERPPTLRLYGWRHPTVSLGRNERWRGAVRLERLSERGVRLVRRPTGGRAVLHQRELTYSVTAATDRRSPLGSRLDDTLMRISAALSEAMAGLGIRADVTRRDHPVNRSDGPCFETASRYELVANGRKLVGHAQLRTSTAFLQHGSMPVFDPIGPLRALGPGHRRPRTTIDTGAALAAWAPEAPDRFATRLADVFTRHFGSRPHWVPVSVVDREAVIRLERGRYGNAGWTYRR